jgi:integrase
MASLVRPWKVTYQLDGKRVPKGTAGAKKVRERSTKWYGRGVPGCGRRRIPLATDKEAARRMLAQLVKDAEQGAAGMPSRAATRMPLADHLAAFEQAVRLGLASRSKKKRRPDAHEVATVVGWVRQSLAGCGFRTLADLDAAAPAKLAAYLQGRAALPRKDGGLSARTAHFYLATVKRFVWWLAVRQAAPVRPGLFDDVPGFDADARPVHARREIEPAELERLLATTRASARVYRGLTGADRYHLYLTAFSTGFRGSELAALRPGNFALDGPEPLVILSGNETKNGRPARQPLHPAVAAELRPYLAGRPADAPVWPGRWSGRKSVVMIRPDLRAAVIPYVVDTPEGKRYADFHSLRHSFLSSLAAADVGIKELQTLARHSTPTLTFGVYAHARTEALTAAVGRLPIPVAGQTASPLAGLSRAELERAVEALVLANRLLMTVAGLDAHRDAPPAAGLGSPVIAPEQNPARRRAPRAGSRPLENKAREAS